MSEFDLFDNLLAEKLKELLFEFNLQTKMKLITWCHFNHYSMNNTRNKLPASPESAIKRINFPQLQTQDSQSQYAVGTHFCNICN